MKMSHEEILNMINGELQSQYEQGQINSNICHMLSKNFERILNERAEQSRVKVIDEKTQEFNGIVFKKAGHRKTYRAFVSLHHYVYEYYNEKIPEGYEIHHKNENPDDNNIENLECLTPEEHKFKHLKSCYCSYCGKYIGERFEHRKSTGNHFCSSTCKNKWSDYRRKYSMLVCTCPICGKEYTTKNKGKKTVKTCSRSCGSVLAHRTRKSKEA